MPNIVGFSMNRDEEYCFSNANPIYIGTISRDCLPTSEKLGIHFFSKKFIPRLSAASGYDPLFVLPIKLLYYYHINSDRLMIAKFYSPPTVREVR